MESEIKTEVEAEMEDPEVNWGCEDIRNMEINNVIKVEPESMDAEFPETTPFEMDAACVTSNDSAIEEHPFYNEFEISIKVEPDLLSDESPKTKSQGIETVSSNYDPLASIEQPSIQQQQQTKTEINLEPDPSGDGNFNSGSNKKCMDSTVRDTLVAVEQSGRSGSKNPELKSGSSVSQRPFKTESKFFSSVTDTSRPHYQATDKISIKTEFDPDESSKTAPKENCTASSVPDTSTVMEQPYIQPYQIKTVVKVELGSDSDEPLKTTNVPDAAKSKEYAVIKIEELVKELAETADESDKDVGQCGSSLEAAEEEAVMKAKERIRKIAYCYYKSERQGEPSFADPYAEFENASRHPKCMYSLEELKKIAMRIPARLGVKHRIIFIQKCYICGMDPDTWDWEQYNQMRPDPPTPHPQCKLNYDALKVLAKQMRLEGEKRGGFLIKVYHRGKDPYKLLENLRKNHSPPWCRFETGKHSASSRYAMLDKRYPHPHCKYTLGELKTMAVQIPESFGVETRMTFIHRCYVNGIDPALEDWTQYKENPYYEYEDLTPHKNCKHSINELKRMAERIPESSGVQIRVQFVFRCYILGKNPETDDWTKYKSNATEFIDNPFKVPSSRSGVRLAEFEGLPPHPECKYSLEKIKNMAERIPESYGTEARVHFIRRCYRYGHDPNTEKWAKYFEPTLINPPVNKDDPYAEFDNMFPNQQCSYSFEELKRIAEEIPESFGIETRLNFIRQCYRNGKDPATEDWTQYNIDPYYDIIAKPCHPKNKHSIADLKKMSERIPESVGMLVRIQFVRRCYQGGKNPLNEDWTKYTIVRQMQPDAQKSFGTGSMSDSPPQKPKNPYSQFEGMSPHPKCQHSLEEIKTMAESKFRDSIEHRIQFICQCYQFGMPPNKSPGTDSSYESPLPDRCLMNYIKKYKQHPRCKHSLEELVSMALTLPSLKTMEHFMYLTYAQGEDPLNWLYHYKSTTSDSGSTVKNRSFESAIVISSRLGSKQVVDISSNGSSHMTESCLPAKDYRDYRSKSTGGVMLNNPPALPSPGGQPFNLLSIAPPTIGIRNVRPVNSAASGQSLLPIPPPIGGLPNNGSLAPSGRRVLLPTPPAVGGPLSTSPATPNLRGMPPPTLGPLGKFPLSVPVDDGRPQRIPDPTKPLSSVPAGKCLLPAPPHVSCMVGNLSLPPFSIPPPPVDDVPLNSTVTTPEPSHTHSQKLPTTPPKLGQDSTVCLKRKTSYQEPIPLKKTLLVETSTTVNYISAPVPPLYIVPSGYPNVCLSEEQMDVIENGILEAILNMDDDSSKPTFKESFRSNGQYGFVCDDFTKKWLFGFLKTFQPWPDVALSIISNDPTKVCANAILSRCKDDDEKVLKFIGKQNKGLDVSKWEVVERWDTSDSKTCMNLMVDEGSAKVLESCDHINFKLGCGKIIVARKEMRSCETGNRSRPELMSPTAFGTSENQMGIEHHDETTVSSSCGVRWETEVVQSSGGSRSQKPVQSCRSIGKGHRQYERTDASRLYMCSLPYSSSSDDNHCRKRGHSSKRGSSRSPSSGLHGRPKNYSTKKSSPKHINSICSRKRSRYNEDSHLRTSRQDTDRARRHVEPSSGRRTLQRPTRPSSSDRRSCKKEHSLQNEHIRNDYDLLRSRTSGGVSSKQNVNRCENSLPSPSSQALEKSTRIPSPDAFDLSEGELTPSPPPSPLCRPDRPLQETCFSPTPNPMGSQLQDATTQRFRKLIAAGFSCGKALEFTRAYCRREMSPLPPVTPDSLSNSSNTDPTESLQTRKKSDLKAGCTKSHSNDDAEMAQKMLKWFQEK